MAFTKKDIDIEKKIIKIDKVLIFKKNQDEIKLIPKLEPGFREISIPLALTEVIAQLVKQLIRNKRVRIYRTK